jgi:hypothetical protein
MLIFGKHSLAMALENGISFCIGWLCSSRLAAKNSIRRCSTVAPHVSSLLVQMHVLSRFRWLSRSLFR